MSLASEINRTETEKNKTKKVATNIDNKLVELGGEQAINLADVPNKIGAMVTKNYKRITRFNLNKDITYTNTGFKSFEIPLNLEYVPSEIIIRFGNGGNPRQLISSKHSYNVETMAPRRSTPGVGAACIKKITKESCTVQFDYSSNTAGGTDPHYLYDLIAIE